MVSWLFTNFINILNSSTSLIISSAIKGSVGLMVAMFLCNRKLNMPSKYKHTILFTALLGMLIIPIATQVLTIYNTPTFHIQPFGNEPPNYENQYLSKSSLKNIEQQANSQNEVKTSESKVKTNIASITLLSTIWITGILIFSLRIFYGFKGLYKLKKHTIKLVVDKNKEQLLKDIKKELNVKRNVKLIMTPAISSPFSAGLIKPYIFVPATASNWSEVHWRMMLTHELAHIKRLDFVKNLLLQALCTIYWFNFLIWIAANYLRDERENACDDFVIKSGIKPHIYASYLLKMLQILPVSKKVHLVVNSISGTSKAELRIVNILNSKNKKKPKIFSYTFGQLVLVCIGIYSSFIIFDFNRVYTKSDSFDIYFQQNLVSLDYKDFGIKIENASPRDIPTYWPLGENSIGQLVYSNNSSIRWGTISSSDNESDCFFAAADGVVKEVTQLSEDKPFKKIIIEHKNNFDTMYYSITDTNLHTGDFIKKGDFIGSANGCKAYFYIFYETKTLNPLPFMELDSLFVK